MLLTWKISICFVGFVCIRHVKYAFDFDVVANALDGSKNIVVNKNQSGQAIVHVSVPIVKFKAIVGYLVLSTQSSTIDMIVYEERAAIMKVFMIASLITIILSLILSNTIAKPMRELADAADELTNNLNIRKKIYVYLELYQPLMKDLKSKLILKIKLKYGSN